MSTYSAPRIAWLAPGGWHPPELPERLILGAALALGVDSFEAIVADLPARGHQLRQRKIVELPLADVLDRELGDEIAALRDLSHVDRLAVRIAVFDGECESIGGRVFLAALRRRAHCHGGVELAIRGVGDRERRATHRRWRQLDVGDRRVALHRLLVRAARRVVEAEAGERLRARVLRHGHQREGHRLRAVPAAIVELSGHILEQRAGLGVAAEQRHAHEHHRAIAQQRAEGVGIGIGEHESLETILLHQGFRHVGFAGELVRRGQQPAFRQRQRGVFAQAVHRADLGLAGERQRVQAIGLRVALGMRRGRAHAWPGSCLARIPAAARHLFW